MPISRRTFMRTSTAAAVLSAIPGDRLLANTYNSKGDDPVAHPFDPAAAHALALRAVDAARAAGAAYAEVRVTRIVSQQFQRRDNPVVGGAVRDQEELAVGVRALVNGYWGFMASPYWHPDEVTLLAKGAVAQAKTNALGPDRHVAWETLAPVTGSWVAPGIDPFSISVEEKLDFINAWRLSLLDIPKGGRLIATPESARLDFSRIEKVMASTEGSAITQTFYTLFGQFPFSLGLNDWRAMSNGQRIRMAAEGLSYQQSGWNGVLNAKIQDQIPVLFEQGYEMLRTPHKPVDIGRYDIVFDAPTAVSAVMNTFAKATQLDRALGHEANAGGTSYLGPDPLELLGTFKAASSQVSINGNRSSSGGAATTKWDDEGMVPDDFSIIKDGILVDYQTTREQAPWLKPWYEKQGKAVRSHGCASADSALNIPLQHLPNFAMQPAASSATLQTLIADIPKGLAVFGGVLSTDFQAKTGAGRGLTREIVNGKLGKICDGAGFLFGSTELWNNVQAIGGSTSTTTLGAMVFKGQPMQTQIFSVSAVPMTVKNMTIVDYRRRG